MFATLPKATIFLTALLFGVVSFMSQGIANDALAAGHPAVKFVEKLGTSAIASLTAKDITTREREKRVRDLLRTNFDLTTIGRFALGTYWKSASETQKKEYMDLFEDMVVKTYTQRFSEYSGQSFQVAGAIPASDKDSVVSSQLVQNDGSSINVEWRVRSKNGSMKVIDVVVEGISMSVTQRSDFSSVIQKGNGDVDALINTLRLRQNGAIAEKF